jgi:hypothetical protein
MPEPTLDRSGANTSFVVKRGEGLPKPVKPKLLTSGSVRTALPERVMALAAIQASTESKALKDAKKVDILLSLRTRENEAMLRIPAPHLHQLDEVVRQRDGAFLFVLRREAKV